MKEYEMGGHVACKGEMRSAYRIFGQKTWR